MAESANPTPGPNSSESLRAVRDVLERSDLPMAVGDITEEVDYSRRTVHSRVKELKEDGVVECNEIGGSKAYYMKGRVMLEPNDVSVSAFVADKDGSAKRGSNIVQMMIGTALIALAVGIGGTAGWFIAGGVVTFCALQAFALLKQSSPLSEWLNGSAVASDGQ